MLSSAAASAFAFLDTLLFSKSYRSDKILNKKGMMLKDFAHEKTAVDKYDKENT